MNKEEEIQKILEVCNKDSGIALVVRVFTEIMLDNQKWRRIARVMFNRCWVQKDRFCGMCEFREDCERERTIKAEE